MHVSTKTRQLVVRQEWCKGCGICVAFCPRSVLRMVDGHVSIVAGDQCIQCLMCEKLCPDYAIYFDDKQVGI